MKFFIVTANSATQQQRNAITNCFHGKPQFGFWHWTPDFWIIQTTNDLVTADFVRSEISNVAPNLFFAVFGVIPRFNDWSMFADPKWAEWINQNWR